MSLSKQCKNCLEEWALEAFPPDRRTKDGLGTTCVYCESVLDSTGAKRCCLCLEFKEKSLFGRDIKAADGLHKVCIQCATKPTRSHQKLWPERFARNKARYTAANKALSTSRARRRHLTQTYNITEDEYWELFDAQGGVCALCGVKPKTRNLQVDHDHSCCKGQTSCGKCVRGLLCRRCNSDLMPFIDHRRHAVEAAFEYVKEPPWQKLSATKTSRSSSTE